MCLIDSDVYRLCLDHHREVRDLDFVVYRSLPIPFFGDVAAYKASRIKVLTAALNPSDKEFPSANPRFNLARGLSGPDELEGELSAYFRRNPYRAWFRSFEFVLNGLGASYGGQMANGPYHHTALHVDMCSPIATFPTWSGLSQARRAKLTPTGREAFEQLVANLQPHIIIASLGWGHLNGWHADFEAGRTWPPLHTYTTAVGGKALRSALQVQTRALRTRYMHPYIFANASAANTPFGRFHTDRKREVGSLLLRALDAFAVTESAR